MREAMIVSASRRTDIPNYYSEWFYNRIKEGHVLVKNPMNPHQVSRIALAPEIVDCIIFWTKNPAPMLNSLDKLKGYPYYFQFTLTGYGKDIEPYIPDKRQQVIPAFQELAGKIGKERVIWRYDPIFFTEKYTREYHLKAFTEIAGSLRGYTDKVVISFLDWYAKMKKNMNGILTIEHAEIGDFAKELVGIAEKSGIKITACAERMDLAGYGIGHSSCINKSLIESIIGCKINAGKDKNQRLECGCIESVEIGAYDTCKNGCKYCYANYSRDRVEAKAGIYNPLSPLLCSGLGENDKITERKVKGLKAAQISL